MCAPLRHTSACKPTRGPQPRGNVRDGASIQGYRLSPFFIFLSAHLPCGAPTTVGLPGFANGPQGRAARWTVATVAAG